MRKTKKALASLAIAGMVLSMAPMAAFAATTQDSTTGRIAGADRIETAVKVAQAGWTTAATVIVAPAADANLVDALAAAPLAGQEKAPILLTNGAGLDAKTKQEIIDLKATKVYAVGALSDQVVTDLQGISGVSVEALKGADRIETATKIAAKLTAPKGSFVVGYNALADALSVASYASANGYEILVANPDGSLPSSEATTGTSYVIGGPTLVKDVAGTTRIYGADRFETNQKVLAALSYSYDKVYVANGNDEHLVDSLVASSLAGQGTDAIALTDGVSVRAANDLNAKLSASSQTIALGGTSVVPDSTVNSVAYQAPATFAVQSVNAINGKQIQIVFNQAVDSDTVIADGGNASQGYDTLLSNLVTVSRIPATALPTDAKNVVANDMYASLSSDNMTLTLTAKGTSDVNYFDGTYTVYIDKGISTTSGAQLGSYTTTVSVDDTVAPTLTSASYNTATNKIDFVYSEPLEIGPSVTLNGGSPVAVTNNTSRTKWSVDASSYDKGAVVSVSAYGATDYLGNTQASTYSSSVTIASNSTAIAVSSITQKNSNTFRVVFDRTLSGTADTTVGGVFTQGTAAAMVQGSLSVLSNGVAVPAGDITVKRNDSDDSSHRTFDVTLKGSGEVGPDWAFYPSGSDSTTLKVVIGDSTLTDVFGNTNPEIDLTQAMTKVTSGPSLVYARLNADKNGFEVKFNKDIANLTAADVEVREAGVLQIGYTASLGATASVLYISNAGGAAIPNGTYTVRIASGAFQDTNNNDVDATNATITVSGSDATSVGVSASTPSTNAFDVLYTDKVGNSALDPHSYTLDGAALPDATDIYFTDSTKTQVMIELPSSSVNYTTSNTSVLRNVAVYDDNGVKVDPVSMNVSVTDNVKPSLVSASLTGNILTLNFDENLDASAVAGIVTTDTLNDVLSVKGGSLALNGGGTVVASVNGKSVSFIITAGTSNWNTVKSMATVTVKTLDESSTIPGAYTLTDIQGNRVKDAITKTVVKN